MQTIANIMFLLAIGGLLIHNPLNENEIILMDFQFPLAFSICLNRMKYTEINYSGNRENI
jgi:hypothetical protein